MGAMVTEAPPDPTPLPAPEPASKGAAPEARGLLTRLFGISFWGAMRLLGLSILAGFFVRAADFGESASANIPAALGAIVRQAFEAAGWAVQSFWEPALAGALVVLPLWVLWRLVSLPFRK